MSRCETDNGTYIIVYDNLLCVKAIDLDGTKVNMTSTDHLVYQKLRHMHDKLKQDGKPCLPSKRWLAYHLSVSERSVCSSLDKLRRVGLVDWRKTKRYGHQRNVYQVSSVLCHRVYVADSEASVELSEAASQLQRCLQSRMRQ